MLSWGLRTGSRAAPRVPTATLDRTTPGDSAAMENLKFLNFTKHLDPVGLRNSDGGREAPRKAALSAGTGLCGFTSLCSPGLLWAPALLGEDDPW